MRILLYFFCFALAGATQADTVRLQEDAPQRHVVRQGDTLWGIAATFLKDPWRWPDVWKLNRADIHNPHRLFPGDTVVLTQEDGKPRLLVEPGHLTQTIKLSPRVKTEAIITENQPIPSIPLEAIEAVWARGTVGEAKELESAPRILGAMDSRIMLAKGDRVYASRAEIPNHEWRLMRVGKALHNPDKPGETLAYELIYLGQAVTETYGDPLVVRITANNQEIMERDRLLPAWDGHPPLFIPHSPDTPVEARVVSTLDGGLNAGTWMNLVLNRGQRDGLETGHVLTLFKSGRSMADPKCLRAEKLAFMSGGVDGLANDCKINENDRATLPDTAVGTAFVYRVFDRLAFALVLNSSQPVSPGDKARTP